LWTLKANIVGQRLDSKGWQRRQTRIGRQAKATQAVEIFNELTSPELSETTEALLPQHRERLYPPTIALSMFKRQALESDSSCLKAVNGWAAQRAGDRLSPCSVGTGGYPWLKAPRAHARRKIKRHGHDWEPK